jgi:sterol desaturase/sphingolipid hydroxylase (fatty acid hydroxylase superfamily)
MDRTQQLLLSKSGIVLAFALLLFVLERLFPAARGHVANMLIRLIKNLTFLAINTAVSPLVVIPLSALAARWAPAWRPEWWSGSTGLALDLLLLDLWIYWWHRANHEVPLLWRFHQVHHRDEFLDVTTAVRFHVGEVLISALVRAGVIFVLAAPLASVVVFETLVLLGAIFHHSNIKLPPAGERALSFLVVTPSIHWVHHHALRRDTDSNYATVLAVWDRIFRSRSPTARTPEMPIGVEGRRDEELPRLLVLPFRSLEGG